MAGISGEGSGSPLSKPVWSLQGKDVVDIGAVDLEAGETSRLSGPSCRE